MHPNIDLSPVEAQRALSASKELAARAAAQHQQMLEEVRDKFVEIFDNLGKPENLAVTMRTGEIAPDAMTHIVSLAVFNGAGEVVYHPLEAAVQTRLRMKLNNPDEVDVGYETTAKGILPDEAVSDEHLTESGLVLTDIMPPRYTGAVVL